MTKLSGAASEARLAEAWEKVFSQDPATQQIIHVLTRPTEYPIWLTGFPPFEAWMNNGYKASDEIWRTFAEIAIPWPYISNARRAVALGIPNVRILVLERATWESAPLWLQYLAEVHAPATAALAGETLYRVWLEDCRGFGLPERDYDVNLWGAAGVMLAGYQNGDVDWRVFLADDHDQDRSVKEHHYIISMRDFASAHGRLINPPPEAEPILLRRVDLGSLPDWLLALRTYVLWSGWLKEEWHRWDRLPGCYLRVDRSTDRLPSPPGWRSKGFGGDGHESRHCGGIDRRVRDSGAPASGGPRRGRLRAVRDRPGECRTRTRRQELFLWPRDSSG
jgi:hypothetical protein